MESLTSKSSNGDVEVFMINSMPHGTRMTLNSGGFQRSHGAVGVAHVPLLESSWKYLDFSLSPHVLSNEYVNSLL